MKRNFVVDRMAADGFAAGDAAAGVEAFEAVRDAIIALLKEGRGVRLDGIGTLKPAKKLGPLAPKGPGRPMERRAFVSIRLAFPSEIG